MSKRVLVTGGAGFIGSALIRYLLKNEDVEICNFDNLSYAGNLNNLAEIADNKNYQFQEGDVRDVESLYATFNQFAPHVVFHLAAESHVDRSLHSPTNFVASNVLGTANLLEVSRNWLDEDSSRSDEFRLIHVSTDEVFGSIDAPGLFNENTNYQPNSPYSASKAGADHLVRAWNKSFALPVITTNSSNNYGPCQFPEKLIPLMILACLEGKSLPVYGSGENVRDWLYVDDNVAALWLISQEGKLGNNYLIGGGEQKTNLEVVQSVCDLVASRAEVDNARARIELVPDRPGHDFRNAIDYSKLNCELGWSPLETFESGLTKTIAWYLNNQQWVDDVRDGSYRKWIDLNYRQR